MAERLKERYNDAAKGADPGCTPAGAFSEPCGTTAGYKPDLPAVRTSYVFDKVAPPSVKSVPVNVTDEGPGRIRLNLQEGQSSMLRDLRLRRRSDLRIPTVTLLYTNPEPVPSSRNAF